MAGDVKSACWWENNCRWHTSRRHLPLFEIKSLIISFGITKQQQQQQQQTTMKFDENAIKFFFCDKKDGIGFSERTFGRLTSEDIFSPDDLAGLNENTIVQIFKNFAKPGVGPAFATEDDEKNGTVTVMELPSFGVSGKSRDRFTAAVGAATYYDKVGRELTPENMTWSVIYNFQLQHDAMLTREDVALEVPKFGKTHGASIPRWMEAIQAFFRHKLGVYGVPLSWIIRDVSPVDMPGPDLLHGQPHSALGNVEEELIHRTDHANPLFPMDNGALYDFLEQATRGTKLATTIINYRKKRDGRGAWLAIQAQHAGVDLWETLIRTAQATYARKWTGLNNTTLVQFVSRLRKAFADHQEASENVSTEVPNGRSKVTILMDAIETSDPGVLARMAAIQQDEANKRENFEHAATYLVPACPVAKKQSNKLKITAGVSSVQSDLRVSVGPKTGVEIRWFKPHEWKKLSRAQQDEVRELRPPDEQGRSSKRKHSGMAGKNGKKKFKSLVSSVMGPNMDEVNKSIQTLVETQASMVSALKSMKKSKATVGSAKTVVVSGDDSDLDAQVEKAQAAALSLNSILKKKKSD